MGSGCGGRGYVHTLSPFRIFSFCSSPQPSGITHSCSGHGSGARWWTTRVSLSSNVSMQRLHLNLGCMCCRKTCSLSQSSAGCVASRARSRGGWYELDIAYTVPAALTERPVRIPLRVAPVERTRQLRRKILLRRCWLCR